jgi:hypothetical protein
MLLQLFEILLPVVLLILVVGAAILWTKTRGMAVLLQLIAFSLAFLLQLVQSLAHYLMKFGKSALFDVTNTESWRGVAQIGFLIILITLPVGYLWYALSHKRI